MPALTRISTYDNSQNLQHLTQQNQTQRTKVQNALCTGLKGDYYPDAPKSTGLVLELSMQAQRLNYFIGKNERTKNSLGLYEASIDKMITLLNDLRELCVSFNTSFNNNYDYYKAQSQNYQKAFEACLNSTDEEGRYIFAGIMSNQAPVDLTNYHPDSFDIPNNSYFQASDRTYPLSMSDRHPSLEFRLTAQESAFEKGLRAFSLAKNLDDTKSGEEIKNYIQNVDRLADKAHKGLTSLPYMKNLTAQKNLDQVTTELHEAQAREEDTCKAAVGADIYETILQQTLLDFQHDSLMYSVKRFSQDNILMDILLKG